ncbi:MAG: DUF1801 domain-containing protein, partial [Chitinophagales bacterium]
SVEQYVQNVVDESKRKDSLLLIEIMTDVTKIKPKMFGTSIIAFSKYHYKYESGHEGDSCLVGFSPRKQNFSIYLAPYFAEKTEEIKKLGKYKLGKGCLYINKLSDVDMDVLKTLIEKSVAYIKKQYPDT